MENIKVLGAVILMGAVWGCQVETGAVRADPVTRTVGSVGAEVGSLVSGSYQETIEFPADLLVQSAEQTMRKMGYQILQVGHRQIHAQLPNQTKIYVTFQSQSERLTLIDIRSAPTNETLCLNTLRRIKQDL